MVFQVVAVVRDVCLGLVQVQNVAQEVGLVQAVKDLKNSFEL